MSNIQQLIQKYNEKKDKKVHSDILEAIRTEKTLWISYSPATKNYYVDYVDGRPTAFIFSEKEYFDAFQDYLLQKYIKISGVENNSKFRSALFGDFYRSGFETVIVDNGQTFLIAELSDIAEKPDFSDMPEEKRPLMNPSLVCAADRFFQSYAVNRATSDMEYNMLVEIYNGKYLLPVLVKNENGTIHEVGTDGKPVAVIPKIKSTDDGKSIIPVFTDWNELKKFDREDKYRASTVNFSDIRKFCSDGNIIVINPFGFNMLIDKKSADIINTTAANSSENRGDNVTIFNLDIIPSDMAEVLKDYFDRNESIKAAYIKGIRRNGTTGYLIIVDCDDSGETDFSGIKKSAEAYAENFSIDFIKYDTSFGKKAVGKSSPFYQKIKIDTD